MLKHFSKCMFFIFIASSLVFLAQSVAALNTNNETFVGPLNGWKNIKTDYGAVGDGVTNDTAAFQSALNDLRNSSGRSMVLYIPNGTYIINNTLNFSRLSNIGGAILGEDPSNTTIFWKGNASLNMIEYNPRDFTLARITFDGNKTAKIILNQQNAFATRNEFSDLVLKNAEVCLSGGTGGSSGESESVIYRCRFSYCSNTSIHVGNPNTLMWWIWDSRFENNTRGITNLQGSGNFFVYQNIFYNSTDADISMGTTLFFGIRDNWSNRSYRFFDSTAINSWAAITLHRNTILDSLANNTIRIGSLGPLILLDNIIRSDSSFTSGTVVQDVGHISGNATFLAINNTFTAENHYGPATAPDQTRIWNISDTVVNATSLSRPAFSQPGTPVRFVPTTFEILPNATATEIQGWIDQASALRGERAVVHLANGTYRINQTLTIPNGSDIQIIGDSWRDGTKLSWNGSVNGTMMRIWGPSHVKLHRIGFDGGTNNASAIIINQSDQAGAKIYVQQTLIKNATGTAFFVNRTQNVTVELYDYEPSQAFVGIKVHGFGPGLETSKVRVLGGSSSSMKFSQEVDNGGWLLVRDMWYETPGTVEGFTGSRTMANFTGSGTFTLHGARMSHPRINNNTVAVRVDGFNGSIAYIGVEDQDPEPVSGSPELVQFKVVGDSPNVNFSVIASTCSGNTSESLTAHCFNVSSATANAGLFASFVVNPDSSHTPVSDKNVNTTEFILPMFTQTRSIGPVSSNQTPNAADVSEIELSGVTIETVINGIIVQSVLTAPAAETTSAVPNAGGSSSLGSSCNTACSEWSECIENVQERTCKGCSGSIVETQSCNVCKESWVCSGWSECEGGLQTRKCVDEHACSTSFSKPALEKECLFSLYNQPEDKSQPDTKLEDEPLVGSAILGIASVGGIKTRYVFAIAAVFIVVITTLLAIELRSYFKPQKQRAYHFGELVSWAKKERAAGTSLKGIRTLLKKKSRLSKKEIDAVMKALRQRRS